MQDWKGLCATCTHARTVRNKRGSEFVMCALHNSVQSFPKYPRLPVLSCVGYRQASQDESTPTPTDHC